MSPNERDMKGVDYSLLRRILDFSGVSKGTMLSKVGVLFHHEAYDVVLARIGPKAKFGYELAPDVVCSHVQSDEIV